MDHLITCILSGKRISPVNPSPPPTKGAGMGPYGGDPQKIGVGFIIHPNAGQGYGDSCGDGCGVSMGSGYARGSGYGGEGGGWTIALDFTNVYDLQYAYAD